MVGIELRFTSEAMDIVEACDQVVNQRTFSGNAFTERMDIEIPDAESQFFKHYSNDKLDQSAGLLDIIKICKRDTFPNVYSLLLSLALNGDIIIPNIWAQWSHIISLCGKVFLYREQSDDTIKEIHGY